MLLSAAHHDADPSSACPSEDALAGFVAGESSPRERASIERHMDACERCAATLNLYGGAYAEPPEGAENEPVPGGRRFAGRYQIRDCVGFGSGGTVYRAHDPELDRVVALKVLNPGPGGTTQPDHRWTREAKVMARVAHPNVVTVHDVGIADDSPFIATEFVEGCTLDEWLAKEPRPWREVLAVFLDAGRGLAGIHACGLIHRDFKPHNVMVGTDGRVRVTDFGLARLVPELGETEEELTTQGDGQLSMEMLAETVMSRTRTGTLVGTPRYMSPEQWRGRRADVRSDQFSFCVALYEGLWGKRPFQGETAVELAEAVCEGEPAPPPSKCSVPRWLGAAVMRGLARDPGARFPDMAALLHALTEAPRRARRRLVTAAVGVAFVAVAGIGYALASLPERACGDDAARLVGVWDRPTRDAVVASLGAAPTEIAREAESAIDDWVAQWQEASRAACEDARTQEVASGHQRELRFSCLDRRLAEMRAVTIVLQGADADTAARAVDIVHTAAAPARCSETEILATAEPTYASPMTKRLSQELTAEVAQVEALRIAGRHDEAEALARSLVDRAEAAGDHAVRAETLAALGLVLSARKQPVEAEKVLRDSVWAAEASGHNAVAATAWIELVNVIGIQREQYEEGLEAAERADAAVHRLGDPEQRMQLASNRAVLESTNGNYERALELQRDVLSQAEALHGEDDLRNVARVHLNIAAVLSHMGRHDEALEHARRGLEIHEARFPNPHPLTAEMLNTIGALELHRGDDEASRAAFERAVQIAEVTLPPDALTRATLLANLAQVQLRAGELDRATQSFERALEIYRAAHGASHPDIALALHNLAAVQDRAGDIEAAIATYREALKIRTETQGEDHPGTAGTAHNLGLVLTNTDQLDEGIALLEGALRIRESSAVDPYLRATSSFMLARAYLKRGDEEQAVQMARSARSHLRSIAPRHAEVLEHVEAWLAKHDDE